jgi:hypothetical protein
MNFCLVFPEICRGHVHVEKKERRRIIIIRRRNGAKTISLPTMFGRLNYHTITTRTVPLLDIFIFTVPK